MEGRAEAPLPSPPSAHLSLCGFNGLRVLSVGGRPTEASSLQVEYPCGTSQGEQPTGGSWLLPIDAQLLKEFWTFKVAPLPSTSLAPPKSTCYDEVTPSVGDQQVPSRLGPHPSRLSRSVSAQEFNTNSVDACVRAGMSGKCDSRVRLGRRSSTAFSVDNTPPAAGSMNRQADPFSFAGFFQARSSALCTRSAKCLSVPLPRLLEVDGEGKQHGGKDKAMDSRVRGGRLLRSQSKDPHFVSVLSLLDAVGVSHTPRSDLSAATSPHGVDLDQVPVCEQSLSPKRLSSLDAATLHQLDRALSGGGAACGSGEPITSPVLGPATASAPPGILGRIYKVRPLGAAASCLALHSALGSSFSRNNSTLLDFAEEQASLAAVQHGLGGSHRRVSASGQLDYLSLFNASNSVAGYASYQSSAAASLSASPNHHQPHVSLAALIGAASGFGAANGGGVAAGASRCSAGAACLPVQSLPADLGRRGATLGAPDMRFFPFSSPEDFYMAATVLLEAKLPGTMPCDALSSSADISQLEAAAKTASARST